MNLLPEHSHAEYQALSMGTTTHTHRPSGIDSLWSRKHDPVCCANEDPSSLRTAQRARSLVETASPNRYDQVPYLSRPQPDSHPNHLAAQARFLGLDPVPVEQSRVLELGCAQAGNLLPMAVAFPTAQFVGLDASAVEIAAGRRIRDDLALQNLDLRHARFEDVDETWGLFDYIICHGVYSWVDAAAQRQILSICRDNLSPQGVVYISYNLLPGWYQRLPLRELMGRMTEGIPRASDQVAAAREALRFLARSLPESEEHYRQLVEAYDHHLADHLDTYIFHEYLSPSNEPIYFHEFIRRAWAHNLQYLSEAEFHSMVPDNISAEVAAELHARASDLMSVEQLLDFIRNRPFRKTLLVHRALVPNRHVEVHALQTLRISGKLEPLGVREVDGQTQLPFPRHPGAHRVMPFRGISGGLFEADTPLSQAALLLLWEHRPNSFTFEALLTQSCAALGRTDPPSDLDRRDVGQTILAAYAGDLVRLRMSRESFQATVSTQPCACPLARYQAERNLEISSRVHQNLRLEPADTLLLQLLDGTRDLNALTHIVAHMLAEGTADMGPRWTEPQPVGAQLPDFLAERLTLFGQLGLLVG